MFYEMSKSELKDFLKDVQNDVENLYKAIDSGEVSFEDAKDELFYLESVIKEVKFRIATSF